MKTYTTEGIVCSSHKLGEADRVISLYTREGLVRAVAKGVRKTKSKFGGRLEPFCHNRLLLYKGKTLDTVQQAELLTAHSSIRGDLGLLAHGSAMLSLTERMGAQESHAGELYDTLVEALSLLEMKCNPLLTLCAFELKVISVLGFLPEFDRCTLCEQPMHEREVGFSAEHGGFLCPYCALTDPLCLPLATNTVRLLRELKYGGLEVVGTLNPAAAAPQELQRLLDMFLRYHLDVNLKSYRYLRGMEAQDWGSDAPPPPMA